MRLIFSKSTWLHLRFPFSLFLLPVYVFALSQVPNADTYKSLIVVIVWHFFIYPASNGYNSYFDKDEGSIALIKNPPKVRLELYYASLALDIAGSLLALTVSLPFALAVIVYGVLSKMYSHPLVRLKKYPVISFLVVFIFQGAFVYWTTYTAVSGLKLFAVWNLNFFLAGMICSCLIGASYPLTQVYQHDEDSERGDITLSILLGIRGSFVFSALLFAAGSLMLGLYWHSLNQMMNFWLFIIISFPVFGVFLNWAVKTWRDPEQASFGNMMRMTFTSGILILIYFVIVWCFK